MKLPDISELEKALRHEFGRRELLERALTHSSLAREAETPGGEKVRDNEPMEFLGDAVLSLITSQALYERYPEFAEGQLTKLRAHLVSAQHLVRAASRLKLGQYLRLGRGEEKSGGRTKATLQVDALEAVLAAVYLDAGFEQAQALVLRLILEPELKRLAKTLAEGGPIMDFKSALQEVLCAAGKRPPKYVLVREEGPEHQRKFTIEVYVLGPGGTENREDAEFIGQGRGGTKKAAEQDAARKALEYLKPLTEAALPAAGAGQNGAAKTF
jgi:ribonuclease-3